MFIDKRHVCVEEERHYVHARVLNVVIKWFISHACYHIFQRHIGQELHMARTYMCYQQIYRPKGNGLIDHLRIFLPYML